MVIGVTDEPAKLVEKYVTDNKVAYPIVIEKGLKSARPLGVSGYPSSVLVDTQGTVVWSGHPAKLPMDLLEKTLVGATAPGFELTPALSSLAKPLEKGDYAKAYAATKALLAGNLDEPSKLAAQKLVDRFESAAKALAEAGARSCEAQLWPEAVANYKALLESYAGVPGSEGADVKLSQLQADPDVKKAIKGQEQLEKADALVGEGEIDAAYAIFKAVAKSCANLKQGEAANFKVQDIEQRGLLGYAKNCPRCREQKAACDKHKKKPK